MVKKKLTKIERIEFWISMILKLFILSLFITSLVRARYFLAFTSALILFSSFLPSLIAKNFKINLPTELDFVVTLFLWAAYVLGEVNSFYDHFPWWDLFLHYSSSLILGIIGFVIIYVLFHTQKIRANPYFVAIFTVAFAVTLAVFWEIFEFSIDQTLGKTMQKSGLVDTMWDLIVACFGAIFVGVLGYLYVKNPRKGFIDYILRKFIDMNKTKFVKK